jgi:hypothetical protein
VDKESYLKQPKRNIHDYKTVGNDKFGKKSLIIVLCCKEMGL